MNTEQLLKNKILSDTINIIEDLECQPVNTKDISFLLELMKTRANKLNDNKLSELIEKSLDTNLDVENNMNYLYDLTSSLRKIEYYIQNDLKLEKEAMTDEELQEAEEGEQAQLDVFESSRGVETSNSIKY